MVDLIRTAYGVEAENGAGRAELAGIGPIRCDRQSPAGTPPETLKLMLQALLADRFKLVVHKDTKPWMRLCCRWGRASRN